MNKERLSIWVANEHCSCNACHAVNYDTKYWIGERVDELLNIQIGNMVSTVCKACALKLVQLIEPEISDSIIGGM